MIPNTGPVSFDNLRQEFGDTVPIAINNYYRGGPNVSSALVQVPTIGNPISLADFHGASTSIPNGAKFSKINIATSHGYHYINGVWVLLPPDTGSRTYSTTNDFITITPNLYTHGSVWQLHTLSNLGGDVLGLATVPVGAGDQATYVYKSNGSDLSDWPNSKFVFNTGGDLDSRWVSSTIVCSCRGTLYGEERVILTEVLTNNVQETDNVTLNYAVTPTEYTRRGMPMTGRPSSTCFAAGVCLSQGGDGLFLMTNSYHGQVWTSPDGLNWTDRPVYDAVGVGVIPPATNNGTTSCVSGNGKAIAISQKGRPLVLSEDGSKFYAHAALPNAHTSGFYGRLAFGNGYFLCVGATSLAAPSNVGVWISTNGINWDYYQQISLTAVLPMSGVTRLEYHGGKFYIFGNGCVFIANA